MDDETARELTILRRVWKAMGCASNPDDFKPTVRDVMWGQALDYIKRHAIGDSRLHRENTELLAELRAAEARIVVCEHQSANYLRMMEQRDDAEARVAEAEAVIAEAPHSSFCKAGYGFAEPCDCWKSRYQAGAGRDQ